MDRKKASQKGAAKTIAEIVLTLTKVQGELFKQQRDIEKNITGMRTEMKNLGSDIGYLIELTEVPGRFSKNNPEEMSYIG